MAPSLQVGQGYPCQRCPGRTDSPLFAWGQSISLSLYTIHANQNQPFSSRCCRTTCSHTPEKIDQQRAGAVALQASGLELAEQEAQWLEESAIDWVTPNQKHKNQCGTFLPCKSMLGLLLV